MIIYGKEKTLRRLTEFRRSGRFPHGIFFYGESGIGKKVLSDYVAMLYLCNRQGEAPCFSCNDCARAEQHQHPDIVYVSDIIGAAKKKTETMRKLISDGYTKPNDGDVRVYIFADAEQLNTECQNALLTFIEEPLSFNRFVFTASSVSGVLPTILSRLVRLDVERNTAGECAAALAAAGVDSEKAASLSVSFGGNIGRALAAVNDEQEIAVINLADEIIKAIAEKDEYSAAVKIRAASTRELQKKLFSLLLRLVHDGLLSADGINTGNSSGKLLAKRLTLKKIYGISEIVSKYSELSELNLNVNITANAFIADIFSII